MQALQDAYEATVHYGKFALKSQGAGVESALKNLQVAENELNNFINQKSYGYSVYGKTEDQLTAMYNEKILNPRQQNAQQRLAAYKTAPRYTLTGPMTEETEFYLSLPDVVDKYIRNQQLIDGRLTEEDMAGWQMTNAQKKLMGQLSESWTDDEFNYYMAADNAGALNDDQREYYKKMGLRLAEENGLIQFADDMEQGEIGDDEARGRMERAEVFYNLPETLEELMSGTITPSKRAVVNDLINSFTDDELAYWTEFAMSGETLLSDEQRNYYDRMGKRLALAEDLPKQNIQEWQMGEYETWLDDYYKRNTLAGAQAWAEADPGSDAQDNYYYLRMENDLANYQVDPNKKDFNPDLPYDPVYWAVNGQTPPGGLLMGPVNQLRQDFTGAGEMLLGLDREIFNSKYGSGTEEEKKEAYAYLDYLKQKKNAAFAPVKIAGMAELASADKQQYAINPEDGWLLNFGKKVHNNADPFSMSALSVAQSVTRGLDVPNQIIQNIRNKNYIAAGDFSSYLPIDKNSDAAVRGRQADAIRAQVMEDHDWNLFGRDVFDDAYGAIMSTADTVTTAALGTAFSGGNPALAKAITGGLLATQAAQSTMDKAYENGANDDQAQLMGVISGALEMVTEWASIGKFYKAKKFNITSSFKDRFFDVLAQAGINASEEAAAEIGNLLTDYFIMGEDSEYYRRRKEYEKLGVEDAHAKVIGELAFEIAEAAYAGGLQGILMGGTSHMISEVNNASAAKQAGEAITSQGTQQSLKDISLALGEDTELGKLAKKYDPKTATYRQTGRLYRQFVKDAPKSMHGPVNESLMLEIDQKLQALGETGDTAKIADAVRAMFAGEDISEEQFQAIAQSEHGLDVAKEMMGVNETETETETKIEEQKAEEDYPPWEDNAADDNAQAAPAQVQNATDQTQADLQDKYDKEVASHNQTKEDLNAMTTLQGETKEALDAKTEEYNQAVTDLETANRNIQTLETTISGMEKDLEDLNAKLEKQEELSEQELQKVQADKAAIESELAIAETSLEGMTTERDELAGRVATLEGEKTALQDKYDKEVASHNQTKEDLNAMTAKQEGTQDALDEMTATQKGTQAALEAVGKALENTQSALRTKNEELQATQDALDKANTTITENEESIKAATKEIETLQEKLNSQEALSEQERQEAQAKIDELNEDIDTYNALLLQAQDDKTKLAGQIETLETEQAELEGQIKTLETEKAELEGQVETLKTDNANLQAQNSSLQADNANLQAQLDEQTAMTDAAEAEAAALQEELDALKKQIPDYRVGNDGEIVVNENGKAVPLEDSSLSEDEKTIITEMGDVDPAMTEAAVNAFAGMKKLFGIDKQNQPAEAQQEATEQPADEGMQDAKSFAKGFKRAVELAKAGKDILDSASPYVAELHEAVKKYAAQYGEALRQEELRKQEQANIQQAHDNGFKTLQENGEKVGVSFARVTKKITEQEKTQLQLIDMFAKKYNLRVHVYDSLHEGEASGSYRRGSNRINLALDAEGGLLTRTVSHESFHFIESWNKDAAQKLQDFVVKTLQSKEGYDLQKAIQDKIAEYDTTREPLTEPEATREIVADSLLDVIGTEENIRKLMKQDRTLVEKISEGLKKIVADLKAMMQRLAGSSAEVKALQGDMNYYSKILQMVDEALTGAKENYAAAQYKSAPAIQDSAVQEYHSDMKGAVTKEDAKAALNGMVSNLFARAEKGWLEKNPDVILDDAVQKFADALKSYQRGEMALENALKREGFDAQPYEMNTVLSYAGRQLLQAEGYEGEFTDEFFDFEGSGIAENMREQFSIKSIAEAAGFEIVFDEGQPIRVLRNGKEVTRVTINDVRQTPIGQMIEMGIARQRAVNPNADYDKLRHDQLKMVADLMTLIVENKDAALVWDIAGSMMFSAIKTNADSQYGTTVDFGTICAKTQSLINSVSATQLRLGRGLTKEEVQVVYEETANAGATVPCPPCYVYTRWIGVPSLLEEMRQNQLKYSGMSEADLNAYMESNPNAKDVKWIQQVLMKKGANGKWQKRSDYKPVPNEILLDLNRGADFAADYPLSWKYRTTRGAALGKAIMPYSDARLGEITQGISNSAKNKGIKKGETNPFLNGNENLAQKLFNNAAKKAKAQNLIGGQRYQSTSDFRPDWGSDYLMTFFEMQAVGANVQLYTKVIEAVDFLASSNAECNLSLISEGDGMVTLEDGTKAMVFSSVAGIDYEGAYEKTQKFDNVQMILVGVNDEVIRMALAGAPVAVKDENGKYRKLDHESGIGFVIPYHGSGSTVAALQIRMAAIGETAEIGNDYTNVQGDKVSPNQTAEQKAMWELRTNILLGKAAQLTEAQKELLNKNKYLRALHKKLYDKNSEWYGVKLNSKQAGQIFPHEYWDTSLTEDQADKNGERFKEYCASMGIIPRFSGAIDPKTKKEFGNFTKDKGYWKLLIDRPMYNRDGTYHAPKAIDVTGISIETIPQAVNTNYGYGDEYTQRIATAATQRINEEQYSMKKSDIAKSVEEDAELFAQVKMDKDAETALQMVQKLYAMTVGGKGYLGEETGKRQIEKGAWKTRLDELVQRLKAETGSTYSDRYIKKSLSNLFTAMDSGESLSDIIMYARDLGKRILYKAPGMIQEKNPEITEAVRILRESRFFLTDDMKSAIREKYGSLKAYQQKNFGRMGIRSKATSNQSGARVNLAEVWQELSDLMPGTFAADAVEADMPEIVDAFLDTAGKKDFGGEYGKNIGAYATDLGLSMMLEYFSLPGAITKESQLRKQFEHQLQEMRTNERLKYEERIADRRKREEMQKARDGVIREISGDVKYLNARIVRESNAMHVPEEMKGAVIDAIKPFLNDTSVFDYKMLMKLREAYEAMMETGVNAETQAARSADGDILNAIKTMEKTIAGRRLSQLTLEELQSVRDVMGNLKKMVTEANEMLVNGKKEAADAIGNEGMVEMAGKKDVKMEKAQNLSYKNTTPIYFFRRIGGVFQRLYEDIREGQNTWAKNMRYAREFADAQAEKYRINEWLKGNETFRFTSERGEEIELSKGLALSIYCTWKREVTNTAQNANHLRMGGFKYPEGTKAYKGVDMRRAHALSSMDVMKIQQFLGKEAIEFADAMVGYLSNEMAAIGNEVSMELYGYRKFTEKYYFPYESSRDFLNQDLTKENFEMADASGALKGWGAAKKLTTKANNPIVIHDFFETWANHVNKMCIYGAFTVATDNMNRIYNYKTPVDSDMTATSIKEEMNRAFGTGAAKYMATLVRDIAGGMRAQDRTKMGKMISRFKKGATAANLQVVVQQPSSIARVMTVMNPRYLMGAVATKKNIEEMRKHSGIATIKEMGRFDTGTGLSATQWLTENIRDEKLMDRAVGKMDKATGYMAEKGDLLTWGTIWHAVKREINHTMPELQIGSDEYFKAVAKRFNDVIDLTQVYDSTLSKSELMRSNSAFDKMATSFMSEPTVTYNMLQDAIVHAKDMGGKKKLLRATSVWVSAALFNAMLKSLISAMRRKDDEERTYIEKYLAEVWGNFSGDMNPAGMIPIARDIVSLFEGYDVNRADMEIYAQMVDAIETLENENKSFYDKVKAITGATGNMLGIPAGNVWRDAEGILNIFRSAPIGETSFRDIKYSVLDETAPILGKFDIYDESAKGYYGRITDAMESGNEEKAEELRGYMQETEGKSESTVNKGIKEQIKNRLIRGEMDEATAMDLLEELGMDADDAYFQVEEWMETARSGDPDYSYSKYNDFDVAVRTGVGLNAAIKELTSHGSDKSDLAGRITSQNKAEYIRLYKTNKVAFADLQARLLTAYEMLGYSREQKMKDMQKWLK